MNLSQLLLRNAHVFSDHPAIYYGRTQLHSYRELFIRSASLASALTGRLQLNEGDRVGLFLENCPEYLEILYGAWIAGLVVVPINSKLHLREVDYVLKNAGVKLLFASEAAMGLSTDQSSTVREIIDPRSKDYSKLLACEPMASRGSSKPDDLAWLFYTSGTTGRPKGVMLTHRNLLAMAMCYFTDLDAVQKRDASVYAAPMSHGAGMCNFAHMIAGAKHVVPESGGFDPAELVTLSQYFRSVSLFAAPTMVKRLVDHVSESGSSPEGFRTIVYGGGPMYVEDIRRGIDVMGDRFVQLYGQGESPMTITALSRYHLSDKSHPRYSQRIASVGVAQTVVEVRVADSEGNSLGVGETGEILVRGETVMKGYWQNPDATTNTIRDGWLFTGDLGSFDEDGFLTLRDRSKDVVISGGSNIYPREVEEVILLHPAVREVAVVGRPHPEWGEELVAFVVSKSSCALTSEDLDRICLAHIARFKRPRSYYFVDELPKNNYGKVLKTELRLRLKDQNQNES